MKLTVTVNADEWVAFVQAIGKAKRDGRNTLTFEVNTDGVAFLHLIDPFITP
jgi:hypothetical protein